jgi:hypothetical protein
VACWPRFDLPACFVALFWAADNGHWLIDDADTILADGRDLVEQHGLDIEATRQAVKAMLDEQPVPLRGAT